MNEEYHEGIDAWEKGSKITECPYKHGTPEWQAWVNGWSDHSDKAFIKFLDNNLDLPTE